MARDRFDHNVDLTVDHKGDNLQRLEIITGVGRRRKWPDDFKAQVVAESLAPGVVISEVARRHGLRPQQLFAWRNQMRSGARACVRATPAEALPFATVVADSAMPQSLSREPPQPSRDQHLRDDGDLIEIVLQHAIVRVHGAADTKALTAVLRAVKAVS